MLSDTEIKTLTDDQKFALESIVDWINNDEETYLFALIGPAGTGKTFLSNQIVANSKYKFGVCVSAPTHKAKNVIADATGKEALTIQAICGLAPNVYLDNFDINNPKFARRNTPQMGLYKLIPIDEVSQLNTDLCSFIKELAYQFKTKVLLIGDMYQVPPVGETKSPILDFADHIIELKQPVRQKPDNPLTVLLDAIRCDITTLTHGFQNKDYEKFINSASALFPDMDFIRINNDTNDKGQKIRENLFRYMFMYHRTMLNDKGQGYEVTRNSDQFTEDVVHYFNTTQFKFDPNYARVCTFTNDSVRSWNTIIRNTVIPGVATKLALNDLLMCYTTVSKGKGNELITNSQEYEVLELEEGNKGTINGWFVTLENTSTKQTTNDMFIVNPDSYEDFVVLHEAAHYEARTQKGKAWTEYYSFKRSYLIMDSLNDYKTSPVKEIAKRLKIQLKNLPSKDLDYGYAITTHKSQGSTYSYSFVDISNIMIRLRVGDDDDRIKRIQFLNLVYVALSRAKEKALLYV